MKPHTGVYDFLHYTRIHAVKARHIYSHTVAMHAYTELELLFFKSKANLLL